MCCGVLRCVAVCCSVNVVDYKVENRQVCVTKCYSTLQCAAVCCIVFWCDAVWVFLV